MRAMDEANPLEVRALVAEIDQFLLREATAHFAAIRTLDDAERGVRWCLTPSDTRNAEL
jgi:hypothetical protein